MEIYQFILFFKMSRLAKDLKRPQHAEFGKILGHNDIHEDSDSTLI